MAGPDDPRDELIDSLLGTAGQPYGNDCLRGVVFARTIGVIRFRRRLKRCVLVASLVGCCLAGMVATGIWRPNGGGRPHPSTERVATSQEPLSPAVPPTVAFAADNLPEKKAPKPSDKAVEASTVIEDPEYTRASKELEALGREKGRAARAITARRACSRIPILWYARS
jgi:hypothetical protein